MLTILDRNGVHYYRLESCGTSGFDLAFNEKSWGMFDCKTLNGIASIATPTDENHGHSRIASYDARTREVVVLFRSGKVEEGIPKAMVINYLFTS